MGIIFGGSVPYSTNILLKTLGKIKCINQYIRKPYSRFFAVRALTHLLVNIHHGNRVEAAEEGVM